MYLGKSDENSKNQDCLQANTQHMEKHENRTWQGGVDPFLPTSTTSQLISLKVHHYMDDYSQCANANLKSNKYV